jgi:hypothetical protein
MLTAAESRRRALLRVREIRLDEVKETTLKTIDRFLGI